jgi:large subunit ribosomal protein L9
VSGVARGGDVKEVKNGFARNYLIPQNLAVPISGEAMLRVDRLKQDAETKRIKLHEDMKAVGEALDGKRIDVEMNAGASGRLYGSVTNAIVAAELSKMTERAIDRRTVELAEPIREVGRHAVRVRLHAEVSANVTVLVHPSDTDPAEFLEALLKAEAEEEERAKE